MQIVEHRGAVVDASKRSYQPSLFEIRFGAARSKRPGGRPEVEKTISDRPSKRSRTEVEKYIPEKDTVANAGTTTNPDELLPVTREGFIERYQVDSMKSVYYQRDWIDAKTAHQWHNELKSLKEWYRPKLKVFGREIQQSRSIAAFSTAPGLELKYSGHQVAMHAPFPPLLEHIAAKLSTDTCLGSEVKFNHAMLNDYENGSVYIGRHSDNVENKVIVTVSLGAPRTWIMEEKKPRGSKEKGRRHKWTLENGSILVMQGNVQKMYTHEIPKEPKVKESRIVVEPRKKSLRKNLDPFSLAVLMLFQSVAKSQLEWLASLNPLEHSLDANNHYWRKTSIIATIGPKSNNVELLTKLRAAGMNIVRLNASHGDHKYFQSVIDNARSVVKNSEGRPLALALDTKGPEMRTGVMEGGEDIRIMAGHEFYVTTDPAYAEKCNSQYLYIDYANLAKKVDVGKTIFIDDGILALEVMKIESDQLVKVRAINNGALSNKKGVNLPLTDVDLPAISEKDRQDIQFAVDNNMDMIFASFIRRGSDVRTIREILGEKGAHIKIISKVENHQGVLNFDEILKESDGIMVARGDLGIEIPAPQVFMAQKMMISKCNIAGKPSICATQMLESMIVNNRPTRAEVSDVANAVLDGADCVMLSGETAKGAYPVEAVKMMAETSFLAEQSISYIPLFNEMRSLTQVPTDTSETVAMAAVSASLEQQAGAILLMSTSGNTARLVSKYRPRCPILTITRDEHTARDVHLYRGCYPFYYPHPRPADNSKWQEDVDNRIKYGLSEALKLGIVEKGDTVIALQGWRGGQGFTNSMRVLTVPDAAKEYQLEMTGPHKH